MIASYGESGHPKSYSDNLYYDYLRKSITRAKNGHWIFEKYGVLHHPKLMYSIGEELASHIPDSASDVVILCTSGIPVGISAALTAKKPMLFFNRNGFPRSEKRGLGPRFRPLKPSGDSMVMIDSHERTRFTSNVCVQESESIFHCSPAQIILPLSFDTCIQTEYTLPLHYVVRLNYSDIAFKLAADVGLDKEILDKMVLNIHSSFWDSLGRKPFDEFYAPGLVRNPKMLVGKRPDLAKIPGLSVEIAELLDRITPDDDGIWELFRDIEIILELAKISSQYIDFAEYDYLLGVSILGTALAISMAQFNSGVFKGKVISYMGHKNGILPHSTELVGKKILPIQARITSGLYPADVYEHVLKRGGTITEYYSVFAPSSSNGLWEQLYRSSIGDLMSRNVSFMSLARPKIGRQI